MPVLAEAAEQRRAERRCEEEQRIKSAMRRVTNSRVARRVPVRLCRRTVRRAGAQAARSGSAQLDRALRFCPTLRDCSAHTPRRATLHGQRLQQCAKSDNLIVRQKKSSNQRNNVTLLRLTTGSCGPPWQPGCTR